MSRGSEATAPPPLLPPATDGGPAVAALGHLAAALAHEVRNPLNSMSIHLELLETRLGKSQGGGTIAEGPLRSLQALREGIARIDATLSGYLDAVGATEAERHPVAVEALLSGAAQRCSEAAAARGVLIAIEPSGEPPREKGDERWTVDAPALAVALDALLDNAIAASRRGGVVRLSASTGEDSGAVVVADDGEGMTPETLAQAMRIGFSTRGHAGLGLAVAKQAIKGQGGSLTLRSDGPGRGTTARIELPFA